MRKVFALIATLTMVLAFSSVALAGGAGGCNYSHAAEYSADKADSSQTVAATPASQQTDVEKLIMAQKDKTAKPVEQTKK